MTSWGALRAELVDVRRSKLSATQRLLGDTIAIADSDWTAPIQLPGWTRAHVAAHLALGADAMVEAVEATRAGRPVRPRTPAETMGDLELGAMRTGLELQIGLDTSAGRLQKLLDSLEPDEWSLTVTWDGIEVPLFALPLARLVEIVIHHVDLDCGYTLINLDARVARWMLEWETRHYPRALRPGIDLRSDTGFRATLGDTSDLVTVTGSDASLVGWLTGRLPRTVVSGAEHLTLGPAL